MISNFLVVHWHKEAQNGNLDLKNHFTNYEPMQDNSICIWKYRLERSCCMMELKLRHSPGTRKEISLLSSILNLAEMLTMSKSGTHLEIIHMLIKTVDTGNPGHIAV